MKRSVMRYNACLTFTYLSENKAPARDSDWGSPP